MVWVRADSNLVMRHLLTVTQAIGSEATMSGISRVNGMSIVNNFGMQDLNALTYDRPRYFGTEGHLIKQTRIVTIP